MHNEQYECTSLLRIFKKNVIGTCYLNIHFSLCTSQQTNTKQLSIETSKHYTMYIVYIIHIHIIYIIHDWEQVKRFFFEI
jgi:hypothetical protein